MREKPQYAIIHYGYVLNSDEIREAYGQEPQKINAKGEKATGAWIKPEDRFVTSSGRITEPFPCSNRRKSILNANTTEETNWFLNEVMKEAEIRGEEFILKRIFYLQTLQKVRKPEYQSFMRYVFVETPRKKHDA